MVTFILPGYSSSNQEWAATVSRSLNVEGEIRPIFWDHWRDEGERFDPKEKARLLSDLAPNKVVNIIAKSVGTLVASYMIENISQQIGKVVFCGIPFNDLSEEEKEVIKKAIKTCGDKIVCYQNDNDPHGNYTQVKDFGDITSKPRDDHEYPYFEEFDKFLH